MSGNRENVLKALSGQRPDRIPVGFWFHFLPMDQMNKGLSDPSLLERTIQGHRKFQREFGPDFVKLMTDGYFYLPVDVSGVKSAGDLPAITFKDSLDRFYRDTMTLVEQGREIFGPDALMFLNVFSPMSHLNDMLTTERYLQFLQEEPQLMAQALDKVADALMEGIRQAVKPGLADGVYFSVHNRGRRVPEETYRRYVSPSEEKILAQANALSPHNILHICGYHGFTNTLAVYKHYDVEAVNWAVHAEELSLKDGRDYFGGKTVIGGFKNTTDSILYKGTREEVEAYVEKLITETGREGLILGADCTVPSDIPMERLEWVREKAARLS